MSPAQGDRRPERGSFSDELRPYVNRNEAASIDETAELIRQGRAIPRPEFRSRLKASLVRLEAGGHLGRRPAHLKAAIAACAGSGIALLALAGLGVAGSGPLGF